MPIKIALFGAAGRMGRMILAEAKEAGDIEIAHAYEKPGHELIGEVIEGTAIEESPHEIAKDIQVVVDFSSTETAIRHAQMAAKAGVPFVCGVTGISEAGHAELKRCAEKIAIVWAPNMSPGMTMLFKLGELLTKALPDYDRHIIEIHHTKKKDAPSGSALTLQAALGDAGKTPITSLRLGDVVGEHRLILAGPGEQIELVHRAESRRAFALGTLRAVRWITSQKPGLYGMAEVLGL
ncbi:MAG: 4-hydroxy-tetrahydrodipicolinate reductase [bacterium]